MTISKKLSIAQLILILINIILFIFFFVEESGFFLEFVSDFTLDIPIMLASIVLGILFLGIAIFVIGIAQIIYEVQEKTSGVHLAAGIIALLILIPIINYFIVVAGLILNTIGLAKK